MSEQLRASFSALRGISSPGRASPRVGSFRAGVLEWAEQGGGNEGAEDDAARAHEEGCVVAGVEGRDRGPRVSDVGRVSGRDGGERREAQGAAHLLGGVNKARGQAGLALGNAGGGGQDHSNERERR